MHATVDAPWADVATKTDLAPLATKKDLAATNTRLDALETNFTELRSEMRVGFARVDTRFAELDAKIEHQLRVQLVWLMATLIALGGLIIGLH